MKNSNTSTKLVLTAALTLGIMFSAHGMANADEGQSQRALERAKVQEQVHRALGVRKHRVSNNNVKYVKGDVCYIRETVQQSGKEIQRQKIQEQVHRALGIRTNHNQEKYQLVKSSCDQHYAQKPKVQKTEQQIQREIVQQQVRRALGIRS